MRLVVRLKMLCFCGLLRPMRSTSSEPVALWSRRPSRSPAPANKQASKCERDERERATQELWRTPGGEQVWNRSCDGLRLQTPTRSTVGGGAREAYSEPHRKEKYPKRGNGEFECLGLIIGQCLVVRAKHAYEVELA